MSQSATCAPLLDTSRYGDSIEFRSEREQVILSLFLVDEEMWYQEAFRNIIQAVCFEMQTGIEVFPRLYALLYLLLYQ